MKTNAILMATIGFLLLSLLGSAQTSFNKVLYRSGNQGVQAINLLQTTDGNYIFVGTNGYDYASIVKIDTEGSVVWSKEYTNSEANQSFLDCYETTDGYIVAGYSSPNSTNGEHFLCIKIDFEGEVIWSKTYDFPTTYEYCFDIQATNDGGFVLVGTSAYVDHSALAAKINANGDLVWAQAFATVDCNLELNAARSNPDGTIMMIGTITLRNMPYTSYTLLMKTNSLGVPEWAERIGFPTQASSQGYDILFKNNEYLITINQGDLVTIKTDLNGTPTWARRYNVWGGANSFMHPTPFSALNEIPDGGYIYLATDYYEGGLLKLDANMNPVFHRQLMFSSVNVAPTPDGGFLAIGNGPVMGVSMGEIATPHVGIYKTDSLGESPFCNFDYGVWYDTATPVITAVPITYQGTAIQSEAPQVVSPTVLLTSAECVTYFGGVDEKQQGELSISPNPNHGLFAIQLEKDEQLYQLEVFDNRGNRLYLFTDLCETDHSFDVGQLKPGLYLAVATLNNGIRSQKMVIK